MKRSPAAFLSVVLLLIFIFLFLFIPSVKAENNKFPEIKHPLLSALLLGKTFLDKNTQGLPGPKGEKGEPGIAGEKGIAGEQGLVGPVGLQGLQGLPGLNGKDGTNGKDGQDGKNGIDGLNGVNGTNGINGVSGWEKNETSTTSTGMDKTWTTTCSGSKKVIGGGYSIVTGTVATYYTYENYPSTDNSWTVTVHRSSTVTDWTLKVYAICVNDQ